MKLFITFTTDNHVSTQNIKQKMSIAYYETMKKYLIYYLIAILILINIYYNI